jgi:hypothetical protein
MGYTDHLREFNTDGSVFEATPSIQPFFDGALDWFRFLLGRFERHSVEAYRRELGRAVNAPCSDQPLGPYPRLTWADVAG